VETRKGGARMYNWTGGRIHRVFGEIISAIINDFSEGWSDRGIEIILFKKYCIVCMDSWY